MGTFAVALGVADPQGHRFEEVEAMVDSGATYTVLPASMLERLGVAPHETRKFIMADGSTVERGFGQTWVRLDGRESVSPVVFWDEHSQPLLGAVTLEIFGLGIDPVNGRLPPVDGLMLSPAIRLTHRQQRLLPNAAGSGGGLVAQADSGATGSRASRSSSTVPRPRSGQPARNPFPRWS